MDEDGPREAVARFTFVELLAGLTPQFSIFQPIEGEQRAFRPPQLAQRRGEVVLPLVGGGAGAGSERRSRCPYGSRRRSAASPLRRNAAWLNPVSQIVDKFATEASHGAGI